MTAISFPARLGARMASWRLVAALALGVAVAACSPVYRNHGFIPPAEDLAMVQTGVTTRDELAGLIGQPTSAGLLAGSAWYYVASRFEHYGPREPREISREVLAISFTPDDRVANIERFGLSDGRVVVLSRRVTETSVVDVSFVRQLLANLGNFSAGQLVD